MRKQMPGFPIRVSQIRVHLPSSFWSVGTINSGSWDLEFGIPAENPRFMVPDDPEVRDSYWQRFTDMGKKNHVEFAVSDPFLQMQPLGTGAYE